MEANLQKIGIAKANVIARNAGDTENKSAKTRRPTREMHVRVKTHKSRVCAHPIPGQGMV